MEKVKLLQPQMLIDAPLEIHLCVYALRPDIWTPNVVKACDDNSQDLISSLHFQILLVGGYPNPEVWARVALSRSIESQQDEDCTDMFADERWLCLVIRQEKYEFHALMVEKAKHGEGYERVGVLRVGLPRVKHLVEETPRKICLV